MRRWDHGERGRPPALRGINPACAAVVIGPPRAYAGLRGRIPERVRILERLKGRVDLIPAFFRPRADLEARFSRWKAPLPPYGSLWISWPKQVSGVPTDLTEVVVRAVALAHGLVDVKVCSVDETWSGLKLVYRTKDRN